MSDEVKALAGAADILAAAKGKKRRYTTITLPVSGLTVRIQSWNAREKAVYQNAPINTKDGGFYKVRLDDSELRAIVQSAVDADGHRLFGMEQANELAEWDSADVACLYEAISKHCGLSKTTLEDLIKNLGATTDADPPSG